MGKVIPGCPGKETVKHLLLLLLCICAGSFVWQMLHSPFFTAEKGMGWLDGGAPFYATYKTKDDKYVAVGALEAQFYSNLIEGELFSVDVHFCT